MSAHDHYGGYELDATFVAPEDYQPRQDTSVPAVPPNAYLRKMRGYTPAPVEEAVPSPGMDPRVVYLRERSVETGEVHFPLDEVQVSHSMAPVNTTPKYLGADYLQKWEERYKAREGARVRRQLKFWTVVWICGLCGLIVSSVMLKGLRVVGGGPIVIGASYSSLFAMLIAFATGMLFVRIRDYGWMPWVRLFILSVSKDSDISRWREGYGNSERVELIRRGNDARR